MALNEYIYLLQIREFVSLNKPIYKIGKTKQPNMKRFNNYPKGSKLICQYLCIDCDNIEKKIIYTFKNKYNHKKEYGNEYFEGDANNMMYNIFKIIKSYSNISIENQIDSDNYDSFDEDTNEDIIDTYELYKKHSRIKDIIISNKKKLTGYINFSSNMWYFVIDPELETLEGWLSHHIFGCDDPQIKYDSIIKDIVKKCYNKNPDFYSITYCEYLINKNDVLYVINLLDKSVTPYSNIYPKIITEYNRLIFVEDNILCTIDEVKIVEFIISNIINNKSKFLLYKQLCYSVLVIKSQHMIIYEDDMFYPSYYLYEFLTKILNPNDIIKIKSEKYTLNKNIRLVFITTLNKTLVKKIIYDCKKLNITNIIISSSYNYTYGAQNKSIASKIYNNQKSKECDIELNQYWKLYLEQIKIIADGKSPKNLIDLDIFWSDKYLIKNYLWWCAYYEEITLDNDNTIELNLSSNNSLEDIYSNLSAWFYNTYEKTDNKKDIIKMKEIYTILKESDAYINSSKIEKRNCTYKKLINTFWSNEHFKKYITLSTDKSYILVYHKKINNINY